MSVLNDTEFRELLASPPGSILYVAFLASSYLDISASRACDIPASVPSTSRTTDFLQLRLPYMARCPLCSLGCCLEHNLASTICRTG
ncbi:hypothetical protein QL093DRAFT_2557477 [Fusarium oxysporum]|nr:hypothetical protein QL093DRAFT_2557477 [Fusarium oxysporum]